MKRSDKSFQCHNCKEKPIEWKITIYDCNTFHDNEIWRYCGFCKREIIKILCRTNREFKIERIAKEVVQFT